MTEEIDKLQQAFNRFFKLMKEVTLDNPDIIFQAIIIRNQLATLIQNLSVTGD